ncbi:hypothetical protein A1O7_02726 [Cladophialophora yegresii CBS 114405]|uniref:Uncharacterized protein n=1 Tax=Cladophialophora yegresii CBS 114405 TaxID=1182544 RepID=W9W2U0_9EURO|nr:uncharacterized protein A1O7_02726 [Cladophialophora yegresii CBS 114405]EXJ62293.1 hypothetical protein A1O7_02726 [Cladophialophora yegresii CBS 114405]
MSPPPVPVDQVQTKRMVQRQASSGSLSNSTRGRGRGGLQRQSSSGSMTERTFRTPSPSPSRPVSRSEPQAPPIPTIPQHFAPPATAPVKKKKRASSQEAPQPREFSPSLVRPHNRGQSLDRYGSSQPPVLPASAQRNSYAPSSNDLERTDSKNSVNFSRPLSPRPQSPMAQPSVAQSPALTNGDRVNGEAKSNAVAAAISPVQAASIQQELAQTAKKPVKKKKKKVAGGTVEGSHLHAGTMANNPAVTPLEPSPEPQQPSLSDDQPPSRKTKKRAAVTGESTHFPVVESPRSDSDSDSNVERKREKRTQRASGILQKQPSIVREDWEGEQQEQDTPIQDRVSMDPSAQDVLTLTQDKRPTNAANVSRKIGEPITLPTITDRPRSPEQPASAAPATEDPPAVSMNHLQASGPQPTRGTSLSPSRSTRFSDRLSSDLAAGRKHEPPPRSISPAKPALKHSSPSGADGQIRGSSVTPSESSDISSASLDGPPKRKKSVRVSFDAQPEIVGTAVNGSSPVGSPGKERKSWLGLGKSKPPLSTIPSSGDMEEVMKPRPQLPSFGSVRGQKFKDTNESNTAQTPRSPAETRSLPTDSNNVSRSGTSSEASSAHIPHTTGVSSDHAVGAILAREAQTAAQRNAQNPSNEPLPPEVRSVEGVLSYSDEESNTSEAGEGISVTPTPAPRETSLATTQRATPVLTINQQVTAPVQPVTPQPAQNVQPPQTEVPVVAVSPPTPGEEHRPRDQYLVVVPGGFPVSAESLAKLEESTKVPQGQKAAAEETDEDASDNDSIYSDAAEDPSEMERMGFGSIDAILESPVAPLPRHDTPPPESPLENAPAPSASPLPIESWEETRARWSGIAHQTRQGPSQEAAEVDRPVPAASVPTVLSTPQVASGPLSESANPPNATSIYNQVSQPAQALRSAQSPAPQPAANEPTRKKKTPAAMAAAASVPAASGARQGPPESPLRQKNQGSPYPTVATPSVGHASATGAHFRHSMRASPPPEVESGFRRSMRNESRTSMAGPTNAAPQRRTAPPAVTTPPRQPRAALQKKHIPLATAAAVQAPIPRPKPAPQRVTNDSDSESSFRKARRSKSTTGGKYTMRRSMRGAADPTMRGDTRNGVRSVSPVGRRPFSPPDSSRPMRTTLRASMDNTPTLRGPAEGRRSSSMVGRQQRSNPPVPTVSKQNNRSRIHDSDDSDEEPRPSKFRSRFDDDSDDEVDVPQFAPVRGIPRRNNDEDSTDLDDSSEEDQLTPAAKTPPKLQVPQGNGSAPASSTEALSPNSEKKRGLLGLFRSKKPKDEALSPVTESPQASTMPKTTDTSNPSRLGFASAAERDRMIEQTRARLEAAKEQEHPSSHQQGHAKLQRRHMPDRVMSDSWPLPSALADEKPRPTTADGLLTRNGTTRLNQGSMRNTSQSGEAIGRSGKKKKFPMLRKVFGLTD